MTVLAGKACMSASQGEIAQVMVEGCRSPALGGMALAAIETKATLMRLVGVMTGVAILPRHREIAEAACIHMALHTGNSNMPACQLE